MTELRIKQSSVTEVWVDTPYNAVGGTMERLLIIVCLLLQQLIISMYRQSVHHTAGSMRLMTSIVWQACVAGAPISADCYIHTVTRLEAVCRQHFPDVVMTAVLWLTPAVSLLTVTTCQLTHTTIVRIFHFEELLPVNLLTDLFVLVL